MSSCFSNFFSLPKGSTVVQLKDVEYQLVMRRQESMLFKPVKGCWPIPPHFDPTSKRLQLRGCPPDLHYLWGWLGLAG
jgi:hypothetical protein